MKCCEYFYSEESAKEYMKEITWKNADVELVETYEPNDDEPEKAYTEKIWVVYFNPKPLRK